MQNRRIAGRGETASENVEKMRQLNLMKQRLLKVKVSGINEKVKKVLDKVLSKLKVDPKNYKQFN